LPLSTRDKAGMYNSLGEIVFTNGKTASLVILNDERKRSFKQIARFIERNWEKL